MTRLFMLAIASAVAVAPPPIAAQSSQRVEQPGWSNKPITIQMDSIATGSLVTLLLRDIMRVPYVIAPDVLADRRPTSVKLVIPRDQVPERVVQYLRGIGYTVGLRGGTVYVGRKGGGGSASALPFGGDVSPASGVAPNVPFGSPLEAPSSSYSPSAPVGGEAPPLDGSASSSGAPAYFGPSEIVGYIPAHRSPGYLASVIKGVLPSVVFGAREEQAASQDESRVVPREGPDVLVFSGPPDDVEKARGLIELLDRPRQLVAVKAVVMQVSDIRARGSALSVLASVVGGDFKIGSFGGDAPGSQFVRIGAGAVSAVLSAVREDSRFKVVATPNLTALSGAVATMNSGSQVPTVGAVAYVEGGGPPVQSVVYRDSGITLTVRPVVRGDLIEMDVSEERSTFVRTTTGVEDSPTLQKSSVSAQVVLKSGESVVLAGLNEQSHNDRREGLFGGLLGVRSRDKSESELLVLLSAEIVPFADAPPGRFVTISDPEADEADEADEEAA